MPTRRKVLPAPGRAADWLVLALFLAEVFAFGLFAQKDTDVWWHLRTGQLIRAGAPVPQTDWYTFTAADAPWVDLHWGFQVVASAAHDAFGSVGLNLIKCGVTTLAVALLIATRPRSWPLWAMVLAWQPALLILSGRMYVRPETVTLLWLACFLALLGRWRTRVAGAWLLPLVQVAWVNTQGLFIFGPFLIGVALLDAALTPGAFRPERRAWWSQALAIAALVGLACLLNPYGLRGALFPLDLLKTMGDETFANHIAELSSIPKLIEDSGLPPVPADPAGMLAYLVGSFGSLPVLLQVQLVTIALGGLSFGLVAWARWDRRRSQRREAAAIANTPDPAPPKKRKTAARATSPPRVITHQDPEAAWREGAWWQPLRLILFATFVALSWRATRNSHQFAAVVGTITAWNVGEWAAWSLRPERRANLAAAWAPRLAAGGACLAMIVLVLSGIWYAWSGEGRSVGLGEEPLWYAHDAVRVAGGPDMPDRFLSFHDGHAALYEYYHGPEKKVHTDARLEVIGPGRYAAYVGLKKRIQNDEPGWTEDVGRLGDLAVLTDHRYNAAIGAAMLAHPDLVCVYFDPIAAVFAPPGSVRRPVDFAGRLFRPEAVDAARTWAERRHLTQGLYSMSISLRKPGRLAWFGPVAAWGTAEAVALTIEAPDRPEGWKLLGQLAFLRHDVGPAVAVDWPAPSGLGLDIPRDLQAYRAMAALARVRRLGTEDFLVALATTELLRARGDRDGYIEATEDLLALRPINPFQVEVQTAARTRVDRLRRERDETAGQTWENRAELDALARARLAAGRTRSVIELLEIDLDVDAREWPLTDLLAVLKLSRGRPDEARTLWASAPDPPSAVERDLRLALTDWVDNQFERARERLTSVVAAEPDRFEAWLLLGHVELESRHAEACEAALRRAEAIVAQDPRRRAEASAVRGLLAWITPAAASTNAP